LFYTAEYVLWKVHAELREHSACRGKTQQQPTRLLFGRAARGTFGHETLLAHANDQCTYLDKHVIKLAKHQLPKGRACSRQQGDM
jgi:hypothetical protein